ncbi:glycosyltransferase [Nonomuraea sediminis]|uniref:glycosyltransferase n=1 Tax=Nonomuraea sediminis TaxID=2835864 RepID=UPI001BDC1A95|nr:glycosyltransferase [Nonomuraea sediminis]
MTSVLHVAQPTDGGVAGYVVAAATDQMRRGWHVTVAAPAEGPLRERLAEAGIGHLAWQARRSPGPSSLAEARALGRLVRRLDPDVVHLHSAKAGLAGRLALRGRWPTIFQPHGWSWLPCRGAMERVVTAWERAATSFTDALVCVGEGEAELGRSRGLRGNLVVIRNGIDLERFPPVGLEGRTRARRDLGLAEDVPLVLCPGRVTHQKGQDILLDTWPRVTARCPRALLAIVGDGELADALRERAPAGVRFVGATRDPRPWYAACDVVVLPSRWEGLPLTALEALACGRPVVAFDVPGLAEVLSWDVGELVTFGDERALAEAVSLRLRHPMIAWNEGLSAAVRAKLFDARLTFDRLAELTLATGRPRPS